MMVHSGRETRLIISDNLGTLFFVSPPMSILSWTLLYFSLDNSYLILLTVLRETMFILPFSFPYIIFDLNEF